MRVHEIDWINWKATDQAVICFLFKDNEVLLINKKRGLGAGKVNGPGGKCEPGETHDAAAIRETKEEIGLTPRSVTERGRLFFQFLDGYALEVALFTAEEFDGELRETPEAAPFWVSTDAIPYERMWADDVLWLPRLLEGSNVYGRFLFDGDAMVDYAVSFDG
ncbi:MAG: 8-oxo-dGTP diphosphatase [Alkalispirochaetaceae bacterium]